MNPALESIYGGLIVSIVAIIAAVLGAHGGDVLHWFRYGFASMPARARRAAVMLVFAGVMPFGILQLAARTLPYPIGPDIRMMIAIPGWLVIGYGVVVWQSFIMAEARGADAGRRWFLILSGSVALCVTVIGSTAPLHAPKVAHTCATCAKR